MSPGRIVALAAHMTRCSLRAGLVRAGFGALIVITLLGPVASLTRGAGWALDRELYLCGFLVGSLLALRSGLGDQRERALDTFLRVNFVTRFEHALAVVLSLLALWASVCGAALLAALVASAADLRLAAWATGSLAARSAMLLPLVPPVEATTRLRVPFLVAVLAAVAAGLGISVVGGEAALLRLVGSPGEPGDLGALPPLAARAALSLATGFAAYLAVAALPDRYRPVRPWVRPD